MADTNRCRPAKTNRSGLASWASRLECDAGKRPTALNSLVRSDRNPCAGSSRVTWRSSRAWDQSCADLSRTVRALYRALPNGSSVCALRTDEVTRAGQTNACLGLRAGCRPGSGRACGCRCHCMPRSTDTTKESGHESPKHTRRPDTTHPGEPLRNGDVRGGPCLSLLPGAGAEPAQVQLYEGDRQRAPMPCAGGRVRRRWTAALGEEHTESHTTCLRYGGIGRPPHGHAPGHVAKEDWGRGRRRCASSARWTVPCWNHHSRRQAMPLNAGALPNTPPVPRGSATTRS